ncbi:unnamed protein product [Schistocephalus solidus]|uniref:C2H2-type domain-containing protein n=1 Tax=Schistocephalus solidus TaxID=70667 RepID=A0A183SKU1_SCHSO|nr:unnamed protein product [Schistocephalus solidus]
MLKLIFTAPPFKKRRDDSSPIQQHSSLSSKTRGHIPVSERQQFALLKQMENRELTSDRTPPPSGYSMSPPLAASDPSPSSHGYQRHPHHPSFSASTDSQQQQQQLQQREQREHKSRPTSTVMSADSSPSLTDRRSHPKQMPGHEAPLIKTAKKGDLEGIKILVKEGVDINEQDSSGRTALHECSSRNHSRVVAYLLRHNADPNLKAARGNTALHEAAQAGHVRVIRSLLRHGADPKISNGNVADVGVIVVKLVLVLMACASEDFDCGGLDDISQLAPSCFHGAVIIWSMQIEDSPESSHSNQPGTFTSKKQEPSSPPTTSSRSFTSHDGHQRLHHHHHHQSQSANDSNSRQRRASFVEERKDPGYRPKSEHLPTFEHSSRSEHAKHQKLTDSALTETNSSATTAAVGHRSNLPAVKVPGDGAHFHHHHHHQSSSTTGESNTNQGSHRARSSNSPKDQLPSGLSSQSSRRNSSVHEKAPEALEPHFGRSSTKKDPYAFDDEEQDLSPPLPHSTVGVCSAGNNGTLGTSVATTTASTTAVVTTTMTGAPVSLEGVTSSPITRRFPSASSVPVTPLPSIQVNAHSDQSGPSSVSPNSASSVGPPLKLRFAKEAGHYTLMEQQQLQEHMAEQQRGGRSVPLKSSPSGTPEVKETDSTKSSPTALPGHVQERMFPAALPATLSSYPLPASVTIGTSPAVGETVLTPLKSEGVVHLGSGPVNQSPDAHEAEFSQKLQGDDEDQDTRSQKVPPLRIKLAAGGSSDLGSCEHAVPNSVSTEEVSAPASDAVIKSDIKPESPAPSSLHGSESTESKKFETVVVTSTHISTTSGSEPTSAFTVAKNAETSVSSSSRRRSAAAPTRTASRGQRLAEEGQSEPDKIKAEEPVNPRSSRTLRSHTAAQREREERDRQTDNAPIKKRKIRSKTGDSDAANSTNGSDSRDENGPDLPMTDHGADSCSSFDNTNNHGPSIGISSAKAEQNDGYESTANSAGSSGETGCDVSARTLSSSSSALRAFDDPLKPSPLAWGENPYDKAAALNKGLNELIGKLVELQPKEPTGYQDYLLVTREYLLTDRIPSHLAKANAQALPTCPRCQRIFRARIGLVGHLRTQCTNNPTIPISTSNSANPPSDSPTLTPVINSIAPTITETTSIYSSPVTPTTATTTAFTTTTTTISDGESLLSCTQCDRTFTSRIGLVGHLRIHRTETGEPEQLRLCAEQSVLRAQTRATIALANQPRPLSFCSVMALNGFTYLPPFKSSDHRDEESVRDRFNARILIGWLQDIKDNFQKEKRRLLCRQLHEAESLMMVQKLDWEVKLKELHMCDCRANVFDEILPQHVPLVEVPNDFPLFVHDPI